jgi:hypothetical protein
LDIPIRQADAPSRFAVTDMPRIRRPMDSIMFPGEADPYGAGGVSRAGREYRCRLLRVRVPEEFRVIVEPRIVHDARDGPISNRQRIVRAADGGRLLHQFLVVRAVGDYRTF